MNDAKPDLKRPYYMMAKPSGAICNLNCSYCFYLSKRELYPDVNEFKMSEKVLEAYIREYVEQPVSEITFTWQGGEPTLMGMEFYRKVLELQAKYRLEDKVIQNSIQTNGTFIDEKWAKFFSRNNFLVGISLDGPTELHNRYRRTKGDGPTHQKVMRGIHYLKEFGVEYNILCCLNSVNSEYPLEVYNFLKEYSGTRYWQFIPIVEQSHHSDHNIAPYSISATQYGNFITRVFNRWVRHDLGKISIQLFDVTLRRYLGMNAGLCVYEEECGNALAMEHNGDVFSCDHYVDTEHFLGNIQNTALEDLVDGAVQRQFGRDKKEQLPEYCLNCEVLTLCNGGCPKNRFYKTPSGEGGLNYLCEAYKRYFADTAPYMNFIALQYRNNASSETIMEYICQNPLHFIKDLPSRNEPCYCGSGKKYKHCCDG